jgi:hypothetical protein
MRARLEIQAAWRVAHCHELQSQALFAVSSAQQLPEPLLALWQPQHCCLRSALRPIEMLPLQEVGWQRVVSR